MSGWSERLISAKMLRSNAVLPRSTPPRADLGSLHLFPPTSCRASESPHPRDRHANLKTLVQPPKPPNSPQPAHSIPNIKLKSWRVCPFKSAMLVLNIGCVARHPDIRILKTKAKSFRSRRVCRTPQPVFIDLRGKGRVFRGYPPLGKSFGSDILRGYLFPDPINS
jgi:hypothetical protein